ncbi:MAG: ABC transporter permease [Candidatus Caccovivens sp.]
MKKNNVLSLCVLVKRNILLFLKDKMTVFFSLLAPIIVLMLYILFLGDIQSDTINSIIDSYNLEIEQKFVLAFINNWMVSGVMGVSCITVAFSACTVMVRDRERGTVNDVLSSPVKRWVVFASYVLSCFLITLIICLLVFVVSIIYLVCTGGFFMSFVELLAIIGITILSIVSSSVIAVFVSSFIRTEAALGACSGILSAIIGFITGAYMPLSMFPESIQFFVCFIPGSYSAGLFRNYFLKGPTKILLEKLPADLVQQLVESYSVEMKFFGGSTITAGWMTLALVLSVIIFVGALAIFYSKKKSNIFLQRHKKKKTA